MTDSLSDSEIAAFARVFADSVSARQVLDLAGFPEGAHPWDATSGLAFWTSVSRLLRDGVMSGGRGRLLDAARTLYPNNAVFGSGGPAAAPGRGPASPVAWNLPTRLVRFVGRENLLAQVDAALSESGRVALVALDGMGGVGKTSLAIEYAYRHADRFDVVWWVPSERVDLVEQRLSGLAQPLGLPAGIGSARVWLALRAVQSWLVIFDNVEDVDAVSQFQPSGGGKVLVTSRRRAARRLGTSVAVAPFDRDTSIELLTLRLPEADRTEAGRVAELLGDLPLAVETAAGYLDETDAPIGEYVRFLADNPELAIDDPWHLSVERLRGVSPAAVELLELCAWCGAEPIPVNLFTGNPGLLGGALSKISPEGRQWADTIGALVGYNLARRDHDALVVHRLVTAATRRRTPSERSLHCVETLAGLLRAVLPDEILSNPAGWPAWQSLLSHVLAVTDYTRDKRSPAFNDGCWLVHRAATYLQVHGQLPVATQMFERNLADQKRVLGGNHPDTMASQNSLAGAYREAGRLKRAIGLYEQTVLDRERVLGSDHPDTLLSRNDLAFAYRRAGQPERAIGLYEQTVLDRERVLGSDHPDTLLSRNDLAFAYREAGRLERAIGLYEQTVLDRERVLGSDHPDTLLSRNDLAFAYREAGRLERAIGLYEQTVLDRERVLGSDHPHTLHSRNDLAGAYREAGRLEQAIGMYEQALNDRERVLGIDHPHTLYSRHNLAGAHREAGRVEQAIRLSERSLNDRERVLGSDHPNTLISRNTLALAYWAAGRVEQAMSLFERTLADAERVLDEEHPLLATLRTNLDAVLVVATRTRH
ncbi:FxSxx-COOH system tetratricopeptide repeat protein [Frankia sp. R43]|uniref:FxSxx-COOH system tetratricopeptide repeat protein n=1 Tax=Frankia sp. R43 TaxID=269536 RepID=UPI0009FB0D65|nr:FxSxx-COOH system tetratricopeptide repeat protein [Frankia sp. R43]